MKDNNYKNQSIKEENEIKDYQNNSNNNTKSNFYIQKNNNELNLSFTENRTNEEDKYLSIKNQLKFMYKNNFIAATFDDICAHLIQSSWKKYKIKQLKEESRGMAEVVFSSLQSVQGASNKINQIETLFDLTKTPYRIYDLVLYPGLKNVVKVNSYIIILFNISFFFGFRSSQIMKIYQLSLLMITL